MNFEDGRLHDIRSISQRGLAIYWARLAKDGQMPAFREFEPGSRIHDPKQLAMWNVEGISGRPVFRALYRGSLLDEAFNEGWIGRTLDEVTPLKLRPAIVGGSEECVRTACAIYMILRTADGAGHAVDLERLLLPLGHEGRVQQIVASLQLISLEGTAERRTAASRFDMQSDCVLAVKIPMNCIVGTQTAP